MKTERELETHDMPSPAPAAAPCRPPHLSRSFPPRSPVPPAQPNTPLDPPKNSEHAPWHKKPPWRCPPPLPSACRHSPPVCTLAAGGGGGEGGRLVEHKRTAIPPLTSEQRERRLWWREVAGPEAKTMRRGSATRRLCSGAAWRPSRCSSDVLCSSRTQVWPNLPPTRTQTPAPDPTPSRTPIPSLAPPLGKRRRRALVRYT